MEKVTEDDVMKAIADIGDGATIGAVAKKLNVSFYQVKTKFAHLFELKPVKAGVKPLKDENSSVLPTITEKEVVSTIVTDTPSDKKGFSMILKSVLKSIGTHLVEILFALFFLLISGIYFSDCNYIFATFFNASELQKEVLRFIIPVVEIICILQYFKISKNLNRLNDELQQNTDKDKEAWINKFINEQYEAFSDVQSLMLICFIMCIVAHFFVKFHQLQLDNNHVFIEVFGNSINTMYFIRLGAATAYTVFIGAIYGGSLYVFAKNLQKKK